VKHDDNSSSNKGFTILLSSPPSFTDKSNTDHLTSDDFNCLQPHRRLFSTRLLGKSVQFYDAVSSTNLLLKEAVLNGSAEEGMVIIANHQTAGKGRYERVWIDSPGKSLLFSLLLYPNLQLERISAISLLTSVALRSAVVNSLPADSTAVTTVQTALALKWPNDLMIRHNGMKKVAGILCEGGTTAEGRRFVIVGVGINLNLTEDDIPNELSEKAGSLRFVTGCELSRHSLLQNFLFEMEQYYFRFPTEGGDWIAPLWYEISAIHGSRITVEDRGRSVTGVVSGILPSGALQVITPMGKVETVLTGDSR